MPKIRLATWNIDGWQHANGGNYDVVRNHMTDDDIHTVGFQEVSQIDLLYHKLIHNGPFKDCLYRGSSWSRDGGSYHEGPAIFTRGRIIRSESVHIGTDRNGKQQKRFLLWAEIAFEGASFDFFVTHYSSNTDEDSERTIKRYVGESAEFETDYQVLVGDFNTKDPDVPDQLSNLWTDLDGRTGKDSYTFDNKGNLRKRIDHIFANRVKKFSRISHISSRTSDHKGLKVFLDLRKPTTSQGIERIQNSLATIGFSNVKFDKTLRGGYNRNDADRPAGRVRVGGSGTGWKEWRIVGAKDHAGWSYIKNKEHSLHLRGKDDYKVDLCYPGCSKKERWKLQVHSGSGEDEYRLKHEKTGMYLDADSENEVKLRSLDSQRDQQLWVMKELS